MSNLKNFFNAISNNSRVFTAEDIGDMSPDEFSKNESAIDYQMSTLGIPFNQDLSGNDDVVFVQAYTRSDGKEVKAHYRSKAGHYGNSFASNTGSISTGGIFGNKPSPVMEERNGYFDPITGKKVYYDGTMHFGGEGMPTGAAADTKQTLKLEGGITYNDYQLSPRTSIDDYPTTVEDGFTGLLNKSMLDIGINIIGYGKQQNDAAAMWNIASFGFQNNNYIKRNGTLYNNIDSLSNEYTQYKTKIKEKVKSQFGKDNIPGIVFHENSTVAKAISKSEELKNFINKNKVALRSGKKISGSLRFSGFTNLHNAFGSIDILSAKMNNGYIDVIILDTYDFNKDDQNPIVQMGYSAQKVNLLNPYYTIVKCRYQF